MFHSWKWRQQNLVCELRQGVRSEITSDEQWDAGLRIRYTEYDPGKSNLLNLQPALWDKVDAETPEELAALIELEHESVLAPYHRTEATSLWTYYHQPYNYHPNMVLDLEVLATRIVYTAVPYIPAVRWEFVDGSAILMLGSSIMMGVHRTRLDALERDYLKEADESWQRIKSRSLLDIAERKLPLIPDIRFAPAQDGFISHKEVVAKEESKCWCQWRH